ncbi:hypothetical protein JL722_9023 [Aureococcus anophagefferens]|nr:hypothetical protein JL722_9023 [Aureococcus anophagefferens]
MLRAVELHMLSIGAAAAELPFAVRARASHLRADVFESDDDDDASMRPSDLDSESSRESDGEGESEPTSDDEARLWQDQEEGLRFYHGDIHDIIKHVRMWNTSPYRSRFLSAHATASGIDDLDLSLDVPASLLRAWPALRLGDRDDCPTFEMYACYTNRALDIFAVGALARVCPFSPRATTVEASVDSRASASIGAPRERIAMATSTAGLCAAVRRALGDDRLVQHWSVETDSGASAFVLFRAEADALHVALVKNDGYVRGSAAALAAMRDTLPFEYDDDGGADGFAADLAAALRARPRLELAAGRPSCGSRADGTAGSLFRAPATRATSTTTSSPTSSPGRRAAAAATTRARGADRRKRGGFQPSRFVVRREEEAAAVSVRHTSGA